MTVTILAFVGRSGSGKSTASSYILSQYPQSIKLSFAEPIKLIAKSLWDFTEEQLYGSSPVRQRVDVRHNISPRQALQKLGESVKKVLGHDVWAKDLLAALLPQIMASISLDADQIIVVDDVRFANELHYLKDSLQHMSEVGLYVIKLINSADQLNTPHASHPTETSVDAISDDDLDFVISSNPDSESKDLKSKLDNILKVLL